MGIDSIPTAKRRALGLSQEQLAALLDITQGTVSRNETAADPDTRFVLALDGLALRIQHGENLAATANRIIAERAEQRAA